MGALEYVGMTFVASVLVGVAVTATTNVDITGTVTCGISHVAAAVTGGAASCGDGNAAHASSGSIKDEPTAAEPDGNPTSVADNGDRRDQESGTRDSKRDDARGDRPEPGSNDPKEGGTDGGAPDPSGLGQPVPGTAKPPMPHPPAWEPPDAGGGQHASESPGLEDRATKIAAEGAANSLAGKWPGASRNLSHCLANNGEPLNQDVNAMLSASKTFSTAADGQRDRVVASAVEKAQASGATGPVTFPVNTPWNGVYLGDNQNWYYALNGISYNQTGSVTVAPPKAPGGKWTYDWSTRVNIRDRYNWDGTKSTQIGPFTVTDEQLAKLHRKGLAQEYTAVGTSDDQNSSGDAS